MQIKAITIYIGKWNDKEYAFALSANEAKSIIEASYAFGDPNKEDSALGDKWALESCDDGWRIATRHVEAMIIPVETKFSGEEDTNHICWQCPFCKRDFSDDWKTGDKLPILLSCDCTSDSKFMLGISDEMQA